MTTEPRRINCSHKIEESDPSIAPTDFTIPIRIAKSKSTITPVPKKDCCDYIVPPERQPSCWQKLTPCQKTTICCGSVVAGGGGIVGTLVGTGTVSAAGGGTALIVIGACCGY